MTLRRTVMITVVTSGLLVLGLLFFRVLSDSTVGGAEAVARLSNLNAITMQSAIIVLLGWLLWYVHRRVLLRLESLRRSAERAADGDLEVCISDQRDDEIGQLSRTIDRMCRALRSSRLLVSAETALRASEEAALCASEERQRQLIDALPDLVWVAKPDGAIDTCNRLWHELFEVTPDALGYDWAELMHVNERALWQAAWALALANGASFELEIRLRRREGWRWYLVRAAPIANDRGGILRWVCKAVDIHHQKQLEYNLRNSRNQAELLNQVGLDLVGELDIKRLTQRVTDTARALVDAEFAALFYNDSDLKDSESYQLFAVSGVPKSAFGMPRATELFQPTFTGESVVRCDDVRLDPRFGRDALYPDQAVSHPPVVSYLVVPVRTRFGVVIGALFCGHSQPAQFTMQHERLVLGVAALTATAFDSARLIKAERNLRRLSDRRSMELARSNAELEQFAYICSHDLQEPLRMVSTFLGLLDDRYQGIIDERGRGFIRQAIEGSLRMQNLVRDVLYYSHVGRGKHADEAFHLDLAVDEALSNLKSTVEQCGARIERGPLPIVRANRLQCVQLFQSLIDNALKFRAEQPPIVRIAANQDDHRWRITVADNGIGIDPVQHQRIFQVFQRLHGREQYEGTGIGLSLCQKIVLAHNGTIGVESQPGQGATFWFTLPDSTTHEQTPTTGLRTVVTVPGSTAA